MSGATACGFPTAFTSSRREMSLFAGCVGLAIVLIFRRWHTLFYHTNLGAEHLLFAAFQDIMYAALLAWIFRLLSWRSHGREVNSLLAVSAWLTLAVSAIYAFLGAYVLEFTRYPLTFRLARFADGGEGIRGTVEFLSTP